MLSIGFRVGNLVGGNHPSCYQHFGCMLPEWTLKCTFPMWFTLPLKTTIYFPWKHRPNKCGSSSSWDDANLISRRKVAMLHGQRYSSTSNSHKVGNAMSQGPKEATYSLHKTLGTVHHIIFIFIVKQHECNIRYKQKINQSPCMPLWGGPNTNIDLLSRRVNFPCLYHCTHFLREMSTVCVD